MDKLEAVRVLLVVLGGFMMPIFSDRLRIPAAVGEIFYGVTIGLLIGYEPVSGSLLEFLAMFGFIVLMYMAGLEIEPGVFGPAGYSRLLVLLMYFGLVLLISALAVGFIGMAPFYALILLTTSVALVYAVLREMHLQHTALGQELLFVSSIGEIVSLAALSVVSLSVRFGLTPAGMQHWLKVGMFVLLAYVLMRLFKLLLWWHPELAVLFTRTGTASESGIRSNFLNMFVFVALAALFDLEVMLGAFLGGLLFAAIFSQKRDIMSGMSAIGYGFLIPIFFIHVGMALDPLALIKPLVIGRALGLVGLTLAVRLAAGIVLPLAGFGLRESVLIPIAMAFPLPLVVAVAQIGEELHLLRLYDVEIITGAAIISSVVYPALFRQLRRRLLIADYF